MRKNAFLLFNFFFFLLFISNNSLSQTLIVDYERRANIEYQLRNIKDESQRSFVAKVLSKPTLFRLINSNNFSAFRLVNKNYPEDSSLINESVSLETVKDFKKNLYYKETSLNGKNYIIKDTLNSIEWKFEKESKNILGYECKKAKAIINEEEVIAWICYDIKINDGPDFYYTNKGIILELALKAKSYIATKISFDKSVFNISKPKMGEIISMKQYNKTLSKFKSQFVPKVGF